MNKTWLYLIVTLLLITPALAVGTDTWPSHTGPSIAGKLIAFGLIIAALIVTNSDWWLKWLFILMFGITLIYSTQIAVQVVNSLETTEADVVTINTIQNAFYLVCIMFFILLLVVFVVTILIKMFGYIKEVQDKKKSVSEQIYSEEDREQDIV